VSLPSGEVESRVKPGISVPSKLESKVRLPQRTFTDEELKEIQEKAAVKILVIGCGGSGGNTLSRMMEVGIWGAEAIAVNTDAQDLLYTAADRKILIGKQTTGGLGAGNDPSKGEQAAREDEDIIKDHIYGADMVFVTCGLGGGTGTGAAPVIAEISRKLGALTLGVVTLPFRVEGSRRMSNAKEGLERLKRNVDTVIVIPNDKLLEVSPNLPIGAAFKVADQLIMDAVKGITETITKPGLINLDFADLRAVLQDSGTAIIGIGESDGENRAEEAVEEALHSPLLDADISGAKGALVNVSGGPSLTLEEAEKVVGRVSEVLDPDAQIVWGAQISEEMKNDLRVLIVVTGVYSPYAQMESKVVELRPEKIDLGLEYI